MTNYPNPAAGFAGEHRCMFNITSGIPCHFAAAYRLPSGSLACEVCAARNGGGTLIGRCEPCSEHRHEACQDRHGAVTLPSTTMLGCAPTASYCCCDTGHRS